MHRRTGCSRRGRGNRSRSKPMPAPLTVARREARSAPRAHLLGRRRRGREHGPEGGQGRRIADRSHRQPDRHRWTSGPTRDGLRQAIAEQDAIGVRVVGGRAVTPTSPSVGRRRSLRMAAIGRGDGISSRRRQRHRAVPTRHHHRDPREARRIEHDSRRHDREGHRHDAGTSGGRSVRARRPASRDTRR